MKILFINGSPNRDGNTARLASVLLSGKEYETLNLTDYVIGGYGQRLENDQFMDVIEKIRGADLIVMGSPLYWHNICGQMRCFLDRTYGPFEQGEFAGRSMVFIIQGASPEKWMIDACEYTMKGFARICGFDYLGTVTNKADAESLSRTLA